VRYAACCYIIRSQVSLRDDEHAAGKVEAARQGISLAELLRRSLHRMLPPTRQAPWMRFSGSLQSGDARSSERIDEVVYAEKP
jgi:hypothetical protein